MFWQIIWDGYSGILIPHIAWSDFPKSWLRLARLRLQISGLINHNLGKRKLFVSVAQQYLHDSNYSINLIAIHLGEQLQAGNSLPPALVFQSDNCWRENKNIFVFGFFAVLLLNRATNVVYFICLPQGHTHTDIDQENVPVAKGLKTHDLPTGNSKDVSEYISACYENPPEVKMIRSIYNYRDWLSPYLPKLTGHTKPHVFCFFVNGTGAVEMQWRDFTSTDETWKCGHDDKPIIILNSIPDGTPQLIEPLPIDDKIKVATRKTYDKLNASQQQFYEDLFSAKEQEPDNDALYILQHQFEPKQAQTELFFLPPQKQQPWKSTTSVSVLHQALHPMSTEIDIQSANEIGGDDTSGEDDYDAPVIMEPISQANWIAREYRNLKVSEYGKSKRTRKVNSRFKD